MAALDAGPGAWVGEVAEAWVSRLPIARPLLVGDVGGPMQPAGLRDVRRPRRARRGGRPYPDRAEGLSNADEPISAGIGPSGDDRSTQGVQSVQSMGLMACTSCAL